MKYSLKLAHLFIVILTAGYLTACAAPQSVGPQASTFEIEREAQKQRALAFRRNIADQEKIFATSFPLMAANADFCGKNTRPLYGLVAWNTSALPYNYQNIARQEFGLTEQLAVKSVAKYSPAYNAGLRKGDRLISINGEPLKHTKEAYQQLINLMTMSGYRPIEVFYQRGSEILTGHLQPVTGCAYPVLLSSESNINAYADGNKIVISKGILRFTENQDELALVIAHELAHNAMLHINQKQTNVLAGGLGGLAIDALLGAAGVSTGNQFSRLGQQMGSMAYSVAFEQEADYIGMYYLSRAGYTTNYVADFWRRMASDGSANIDQARTHPTSPQRFLAIEKTHDEISYKKQQGLSLTPNMKK